MRSIEIAKQRDEQKVVYDNTVKQYAAAMGRMGLDEISHALKAFPDSIPVTPEMGAPGEPTPGMVDRSALAEYQQSLPEPIVEKAQTKEISR